jgi:hypothetical protein
LHLALACLIVTLLAQRRFAWGAICIALVLDFYANLMFVVIARTAAIYIRPWGWSGRRHDGFSI